VRQCCYREDIDDKPLGAEWLDATAAAGNQTCQWACKPGHVGYNCTACVDLLPPLPYAAKTQPEEGSGLSCTWGCEQGWSIVKELDACCNVSLPQYAVWNASGARNPRATGQCQWDCIYPKFLSPNDGTCKSCADVHGDQPANGAWLNGGVTCTPQDFTCDPGYDKAKTCGYNGMNIGGESSEPCCILSCHRAGAPLDGDGLRPKCSDAGTCLGNGTCSCVPGHTGLACEHVSPPVVSWSSFADDLLSIRVLFSEASLTNTHSLTLTH